MYCDYQDVNDRIPRQNSHVRNATLLHEELNVQGDSGGKVNILGGDSIGRCDERSSYEHVYISEWLHRYSCLNLLTQLSLIYVCGVRLRAKFTKKKCRIHETNC